MKTKGTKSSALATGQLDAYLAVADDPANIAIAQAFVALLADLLDGIADSAVTHMVIGANKKKDSFLVTVNYADDSKAYVNGAYYDELVSELVIKLADDKVVNLLQG